MPYSNSHISIYGQSLIQLVNALYSFPITSSMKSILFSRMVNISRL